MRLLTLLLFITCVQPVLADSLPDEPHIRVRGTHVEKVVPDILRMSLTITETGQAVDAAVHLVEERSATLIDKLKTIAISDEDITSTQLNVVPHYNWNKREQVYAGSEISRTVEIVLRDLSQYDALIQIIVDAQIGRINSTRLQSSDEAALRKRALQAAMRDAQNKANLLVADLPEKLGSVYAISTVFGSSDPMLGLQMTASGESRAFQPGTIKIKESVEVVYLLSR